eukprot:COSAG02_NODE_12214_length_1579_cov_3.303378_1_plen_66_part_10
MQGAARARRARAATWKNDSPVFKCMYPGCTDGESGQLLYDNSVPCISEIHSEFSDSIHFMQFHTEF